MSAAATPLVWAQVIARNVVPLAGILFLDWNASNVLVLYFVDTVLTFAVLFAGVLHAFAPTIVDDGWAARANSEVGVVAGGLFLAAVVAFPLFVPLIFMLGGQLSVRGMLDDPAFTGGVVWQAIAAFWSYVGLHRALRYATIGELQLKKRFALVFLRWIALVMVAFLGAGFLLGRYAPVLFVALYIAVTIWAEVDPDRFLRAMPGGIDDARPAKLATPVSPRARERRRHKRR